MKALQRISLLSRHRVEPNKKLREEWRHSPARIRGCEIRKTQEIAGKKTEETSQTADSQRARKNTASVSAEPIANSTTSSLNRSRDMTCNANAARLNTLMFSYMDYAVVGYRS